MQLGCLVRYFSLHGPELRSCSHPASSDFFFFFPASLSYGSAGSMKGFSILNCLTSVPWLFVEVIGDFCLRQLSEITQMKVTIRKIFFFPVLK